ncbi:50S ribosomal protein L25 [Patescibacteria group bacterium]|nr:50S ribosomal protein L25 [Patescibacteria group bacterium]
MLSLKGTQRKILGRKVRELRVKGEIPAVLYGPGFDPAVLSVAKKEFDAVYKEVGESSLLSLVMAAKKAPVLIRDVQRHPLSGDTIHVDFYQPRLNEKIKIMVPLSFQGEASAAADFEGTLLQNMHEVEVSSLPQDLPSEITVDVSALKTLEDRILVENLQVDSKVEILAEPDWIVAQVVPKENVEEELAKPVEDETAAVEAVKIVEEKKEEGAPAEEQKSS